MEVEGLGAGKDFKLYPGGGREWDWSETGMRHAPGIPPQHRHHPAGTSPDSNWQRYGTRVSAPDGHALRGSGIGLGMGWLPVTG